MVTLLLRLYHCDRSSECDPKSHHGRNLEPFDPVHSLYRSGSDTACTFV